MCETFIEGVARGEVQRMDGTVTTTALHDEVLRVGQQAAQLAGRGDVVVQQQNAAQGDDPVQNRQGKILKAVTTKAIYTSRMTDLLIPPKVELKFPQVNFKQLVYPRIQNKVLEAKQRDLLFSLTHGIYRNRAVLFQQNRVENNICQNMQEGEPGP